MAVSFDADKGKITGSPVQVLDDLPYRALNGVSQFSVSSNGVFAYSPKSRPTFLGTIVTLNHDGTVVWRSDEVLALGSMDISWSGADLAAVIKEGNGSDIWIIDLSTGARRKLTFNGASLRPIWSPDGNWIVYSTTTGGPLSLYRIATNGSEEPEPLVDAKNHQMAQCFSADGSELIYSEEHAERDWDLWALDMESRESRLLIGEAFRELGAHLSRDGHWLAYASTKTGTSEIYVRPYPALDREWKVSDGGGEWPMWSPKGNMIYYRAGSLIMTASVQTDPEFAPGDSRVLFEWNYQSGSFYPRFTLHPDEDRFVMIDVGKDDLMYEIPIHVTVNWFGELEQMVAAQQ